MERPERNTKSSLKTREKREEGEFPFKQCGIWAWGSFAACLAVNTVMAGHPVSRLLSNVLFVDMGAISMFFSGMLAGADTPQWVRNGCAVTVLSGLIGIVGSITSFF